MKPGKKHNKNGSRVSKNYLMPVILVSILLLTLTGLFAEPAGALFAASKNVAGWVNGEDAEFSAMSETAKNASSAANKYLKYLRNAPDLPEDIQSELSGKLPGEVSDGQPDNPSEAASQSGAAKFQSYHAGSSGGQYATQAGSAGNTSAARTAKGILSPSPGGFLSSPYKSPGGGYYPLKSLPYQDSYDGANNKAKPSSTAVLTPLGGGGSHPYYYLARELQNMLSDKSPHSKPTKVAALIQDKLDKIQAAKPSAGGNAAGQGSVRPPLSGGALLQYLASLPRPAVPGILQAKIPPPPEEEKKEEEEEVPGPKIVSLGPAITEILFALGVGSNVVGVSDSCDYPSRVSSIAKMGNSWELQTDMILSIEPKPKVVFVMKGGQIEDDVNRLKDADIKTISLDDPKDLSQIIENIKIVAEAAGGNPSAVTSAITSGFAKVRFQPPEPKRIFYDMGWSYTASDNSLIGFLLTEAGGENIFGKPELPYNGYGDVSWEDIKKAKPEVVVLSGPASGDYKEIPGVKVCALSKNEKDTVERYGPRLVSGLQVLRSCIYE